MLLIRRNTVPKGKIILLGFFYHAINCHFGDELYLPRLFIILLIRNIWLTWVIVKIDE